MYKNLNPGALGHSIPFDQTVSLAQRYGFAGVDLDLGYLSRLVQKTSLASARDWFDATHLRPGGIGLSAAWRETDSDADFEASLPKFTSEVKLAAEFGCIRCTTWVLPGSNKLNFYQHWDLTLPRLQRLARIMKDHGLRFGLEFVAPFTKRNALKYDFVHTMDGMRAFAAAIGAHTHNTGLLLDSFHLFTAHGSNRDVEFLDPKEVVYVHVNDAVAGRSTDEQLDLEREMVGATGVIDIAGFVRALRKIGYDGPVTVEPFNPAIVAMPVEQAIATTSAALDKALAA